MQELRAVISGLENTTLFEVIVYLLTLGRPLSPKRLQKFNIWFALLTTVLHTHTGSLS